MGTEGVVQRERASQNRLRQVRAEGFEGRVPYVGRLNPWSSSSWAACDPAWATWDAAPSRSCRKRLSFVRISGAGLRESHVHDVIITREAPNYHVE